MLQQMKKKELVQKTVFFSHAAFQKNAYEDWFKKKHSPL